VRKSRFAQVERNDADSNSTDQYGQAPLLGAVWEGHEEVMKGPLEQVHVNPNTADRQVLTPLSIAAGGMSEPWSCCSSGWTLILAVGATVVAEHHCLWLPGSASGSHEAATSAGRCQPQHSPATRPNTTLRSHLGGMGQW